MKKFNQSMETFQTTDIQNYSEPFDSYYNKSEDVYTEHRFNRDGTVCIIHFYPDNKGYDIYKLTESKSKTH